MIRLTRWFSAMAAATLIATLATACGGEPGAQPDIIPATNPVLKTPSAPSSSVASQDANGMRLEQNDAQLDRGMLTYTPLKIVHAGAPVEFHITVTDVGHGAELTSVPAMYHNQAVDPYDVPTAAEITVQIICADGLTCQSQTAQNSQFVATGHPGNWTWRITAQKPGSTLIGIMAVSYQKGGDAFLHAAPLWTVALNVQAAA
jgi:hypothetical protein